MRACVFVDLLDLWAGLREHAPLRATAVARDAAPGRASGDDPIDWDVFPCRLAEEAVRAVGAVQGVEADWAAEVAHAAGGAGGAGGVGDGRVSQDAVDCTGVHVYIGYDPTDRRPKSHGESLGQIPEVRPGLDVVFEKRSPQLTECRVCDRAGTPSCTRCRKATSGTAGRGLGGALASDLLRLVREDAFDCAVLVSGDRGLIPVVDFLLSKGKGVVHASFVPSDLSRASGAWIDLGRVFGSADPARSAGAARDADVKASP